MRVQKSTSLILYGMWRDFFETSNTNEIVKKDEFLRIKVIGYNHQENL